MGNPTQWHSHILIRRCLDSLFELFPMRTPEHASEAGAEGRSFIEGGIEM
jgi:hypothetical protein